MLKSFYNSCEKYSKVHASSHDEVETAYDIYCNRNNGYNNIEPFELLDCESKLEDLKF